MWQIMESELENFTSETNVEVDGVEATVNSPCFVFFSYVGFLKSNFSINPRNLLEAKIKLRKPSTYDTIKWYTGAICWFFFRISTAPRILAWMFTLWRGNLLISSCSCSISYLPVHYYIYIYIFFLTVYSFILFF